MGRWGQGLLQSQDDYDIARDLCDFVGCKVFQPEEEEKDAIVEKLDNGLLAQKFDKILQPSFVPRTSHHSRERIFIILAFLAMELGAKIESKHMVMLKVLRHSLPNMIQQLQLVTALDEYQNDGTAWISGSKSFLETNVPTGSNNKSDTGNEFWFGGLG